MLLNIHVLQWMKFINVVHCCNFQTLYEQSLHIKSAIPHPLIMGVIRGECPVHIASHQVQQVLDGVKYQHCQSICKIL